MLIFRNAIALKVLDIHDSLIEILRANYTVALAEPRTKPGYADTPHLLYKDTFRTLPDNIQFPPAS